MEDVTRITLERGDRKVSVECPGVNLEYFDFMELIEMLITNADYEKRQVETYILEWAEDIKSSRDN